MRASSLRAALPTHSTRLTAQGEGYEAATAIQVVPAQPEPSRRNALLSRAHAPMSSAGIAESRSGPRKPRRALEAAVLAEDDARSNERRPRQIVSKHCWLLAIFSEVQHRAPLHAEMGRITHMPAHHVDELSVALCRPDRGQVPNRPQHETGDPQP
jgi:hypothetical protein